MRISDWSSDVCSSDLARRQRAVERQQVRLRQQRLERHIVDAERPARIARERVVAEQPAAEAGQDARRDQADLPRPDDPRRLAVEIEAEQPVEREIALPHPGIGAVDLRSEEHTSELQSLMRISYAVFCLKKKQTHTHNT